MVLRAGTRRTRNPPAALYPSHPKSELAERTQLAVRIVREIGAHAITYYQQQDIEPRPYIGQFPEELENG